MSVLRLVVHARAERVGACACACTCVCVCVCVGVRVGAGELCVPVPLFAQQAVQR